MLEFLSWPEIQDLQKKGFDRVIFAVGSTEQHGPHLPLRTDEWAGEVIANQVAEKLGKTLQAPTIRPGCSEAHMGFPGTLTISHSTLQALVTDYCDSLARQKFKTIIIVPSHGGNFQPIADVVPAIQKKNKTTKIIAYTDLDRNLRAFKKVWDSMKVDQGAAGIHAGETETSIMLYIDETNVALKKIAKGYDKPLEAKDLSMIYEKGTKAISQSGVLGNPTMAKKEKGGKYLAAYVNDVVSYTEERLR